MDEEHRTNLHKAFSDYKLYEEEYEISKKKTANLLKEIEALKGKKEQLVNQIQQHNESICYYKGVYENLEKTLTEALAQEPKAGLAYEFSENNIQRCNTKLNGSANSRFENSDQNLIHDMGSTNRVHARLSAEIRESDSTIKSLTQSIDDFMLAL